MLKKIIDDYELSANSLDALEKCFPSIASLKIGKQRSNIYKYQNYLRLKERSIHQYQFSKIDLEELSLINLNGTKPFFLRDNSVWTFSNASLNIFEYEALQKAILMKAAKKRYLVEKYRNLRWFLLNQPDQNNETLFCFEELFGEIAAFSVTINQTSKNLNVVRINSNQVALCIGTRPKPNQRMISRICHPYTNKWYILDPGDILTSETINSGPGNEEVGRFNARVRKLTSNDTHQILLFPGQKHLNNDESIFITKKLPFRSELCLFNYSAEGNLNWCLNRQGRKINKNPPSIFGSFKQQELVVKREQEIMFRWQKFNQAGNEINFVTPWFFRAGNNRIIPAFTQNKITALPDSEKIRWYFDNSSSEMFRQRAFLTENIKNILSQKFSQRFIQLFVNCIMESALNEMGFSRAQVGVLWGFKNKIETLKKGYKKAQDTIDKITLKDEKDWKKVDSLDGFAGKVINKMIKILLKTSTGRAILLTCGILVGISLMINAINLVLTPFKPIYSYFFENQTKPKNVVPPSFLGELIKISEDTFLTQKQHLLISMQLDQDTNKWLWVVTDLDKMDQLLKIDLFANVVWSCHPAWIKEPKLILDYSSNSQKIAAAKKFNKPPKKFGPLREILPEHSYFCEKKQILVIWHSNCWCTIRGTDVFARFDLDGELIWTSNPLEVALFLAREMPKPNPAFFGSLLEISPGKIYRSILSESDPAKNIDFVLSVDEDSLEFLWEGYEASSNPYCNPRSEKLLVVEHKTGRIRFATEKQKIGSTLAIKLIPLSQTEPSINQEYKSIFVQEKTNAPIWKDHDRWNVDNHSGQTLSIADLDGRIISEATPGEIKKLLN